MKSHIAIVGNKGALVLKTGAGISFTEKNPMFNNVEMFSAPFELPFNKNRHLAKNIDEIKFRNAKESLLKSLDEMVKTSNGFWLDTIWKKESRGIDFYTNRRQLIEQLTPVELLSFMKSLIENSHFTETLMEAE